MAQLKINPALTGIVAALMLGSASAAYILHPDELLADTKPDLQLEAAVPKAFGDWVLDTNAPVAVVDPLTAQKLQSIYTSTLSRTYVNKSGQKMMLSLAYVKKHSDEGSVHYPNVCYPAQGFNISRQHVSDLNGVVPSHPVNRMLAEVGARVEPVTYWVTIGDSMTVTGVQAKLTQLKYGMSGYVADGMLFRVSSIDRDVDSAWQKQDKFVGDLLNSLSPEIRARFVGKS